MTTELLTDPGHQRQDLRTIEMAVRKGWIIPEQLLEALPKTAAVIALKGKPRDQIAAMALLVKMKESNDRVPMQTAPGRQQTINVGVNVANVPNTGRGLASVILARLRSDGVVADDAGSSAERHR